MKLANKKIYQQEGMMLHLKHWKIEEHPCAKEREIERRRRRKEETPESLPTRISSASVEDQCLTGELYLFPNNLHDPFPDTWKESPSDTEAA